MSDGENNQEDMDGEGQQMDDEMEQNQEDMDPAEEHEANALDYQQMDLRICGDLCK